MTIAPDRPNDETIRSNTVDPTTAGQPWWSYRRPPGPAHDGGVGTPPPPPPIDAHLPTGPIERPAAPARTVSIDLDASPPSAAVPLGVAIGLTFVLMLLARFGSGGLGPLLVPVISVLYAMAFSRYTKVRHPDEPFYGRWVLYGALVKLAASRFRLYTLISTYGSYGDATGYDSYGRQYANAWLKGLPEPMADDLRRTNFVRWFTGVVYYLFGANMVAGYFIFGMLALVGSVLWYRATVEAIPFANKRLYLALVLFAPSMAFWPSAIGKEALMQLGIGVVALGTSIVLRGRFLRGLALALPGGWLLWVVRPHLLALVTIAAGVAYLTGRLRPKSSTAGQLLSRPGGTIVVALLMIFTVSQGAKFLGIDSLSVSSIQAELDEQTERSTQGGSEFDNGGNSLNPIYLPRGAVTVLLRPFPWETDSNLQLISSLESALLAGLIVIRIGSVKLSFTRARSSPFIIYAWTLTLAYSMTFSSFANFGLLVRQRSLVLPALFVLLCLEDDREPEDESWRSIAPGVASDAR